MALSLTLTIPVSGQAWYGISDNDDGGEYLRQGMINVHDDLTSIKTLLEAMDADDLDIIPDLAGNSGLFVKVNGAETAFEYGVGSAAAHAADHLPAGSDTINTDALGVTATGTNYTESAATVVGHLTGIDTKLAELDAIDIAGQTTQGNLFTGTTPTAGGDIEMAGNDIMSNGEVSIHVDTVAAGNGGVRVRSLGANVSGFSVDGAQTNIGLLLAGKGTGRVKATGNWAGTPLLKAVREDVVIVDGAIITYSHTLVEDNGNGDGSLSDEGQFVVCQSTGGTVFFPTTPQQGWTVRIFSDATGIITLQGGGADTVNGGVTKRLLNRYDSAICTYVGTDWLCQGDAVT